MLCIVIVDYIVMVCFCLVLVDVFFTKMFSFFSAKARLNDLMQQDRELTADDRAKINPCNSLSIDQALDFVKNPVACCERMQVLIQKLVEIVHTKRDDPKTRGMILKLSKSITHI